MTAPALAEVQAADARTASFAALIRHLNATPLPDGCEAAQVTIDVLTEAARLEMSHAARVAATMRAQYNDAHCPECERLYTDHDEAERAGCAFVREDIAASEARP